VGKNTIASNGGIRIARVAMTIPANKNHLITTLESYGLWLAHLGRCRTNSSCLMFLMLGFVWGFEFWGPDRSQFGVTCSGHSVNCGTGDKLITLPLLLSSGS